MTVPLDLRREITRLERELYRYKQDYFDACDANQRLSLLLLASEKERIALARHIRMTSGADQSVEANKKGPAA